ncbi:MAG TPA: Enamidase, partial [Dongiaceae bacterium]|nr:Enamidase [Dongiaceae bacterium]
MAEAQGAGDFAGRMVIKNIGLLLSGDLNRPILDADTIVADKGRITAIGRAKSLDTSGARIEIDAK